MKLKSLVRASMTEGMDIFNMRKGGKGAKLAVAGGMFLAFFSWAVSMIIPLRAMGGEVAILAMAVALTSLITLIEGIYKSSNLIFNCRDDDMLLSLPLTRAQIVALRIFKFYIFEVIFNSLYLVPVMLAYGLFASPAWWYWPVSVAMVILLPVIPIAISCVVGAVIAALSSRSKRHNLMQILLAFAFMLLGVVFSFKARDWTRNIGDYAGGISAAINNVYYPARVYTELTLQFDLVKLMVFVLIHAAVMVVAVAFIAKIYFRVNSRMKTVATAAKRKKAVFASRVRRPFLALMKKELNRFFSTPVFVTNAGFGLILFLIGVGIICLKFNDLAPMFENQEAPITLDVVRGYLPLATFGLMAFCGMMTFMTAVMVSLEGRAINLAKTLPVSARKVLLAKVGASLVIVWPPILAGIVAMIVRFQFGIWESLLLIVAGIMLPLAVELFGILVNLKHAKFDAENDTEIVKQSTSIAIATFVGLGGSMVVIGVVVALTFAVGQTLALAVIDAVLVLLFGGLYLYFAKTCEEKFKALSA